MNLLCVGEPAPDVTLRDAAGGELHLSDFWQLQPTVFVFLRHFG